jgi:two-component system, NarL family, nitrate/nitrite response regulator NarL
LFIAARARLYGDALASLIAVRSRIAVVGSASTPVECISRCARLLPDVVLIDVDFPEPVAVIGTLRELSPPPAVIALRVAQAEPELISLARAGAANFITLQESLAELVRAIEALSSDALPCSPWVAGALLRGLQRDAHWPGELCALTKREREVAELLEAGLSNKEIGRELCIEMPTVKNHVHNVLDKLRVSRRADVGAVVRAAESRV